MPDQKPAEAQMRRLSRRSFATGAAAAVAGVAGWKWLGATDVEDGVPWPLRRMLRWNQGVAETLGAPRGLAPTFAPEFAVGPPRTNGLVGLDTDVDTARWPLRIEHEGRANTVIELTSLAAVPRVEQVTEFKCVEGWSAVMHFAGYGFRQFLTAFKLGTRSGAAPDPERRPDDLYRYVYLATPAIRMRPNSVNDFMRRSLRATFFTAPRTSRSRGRPSNPSAARPESG